MKILFFADLHLTNKKSIFPKNGQVSVLIEAQKKFVEYVCYMAEKEKVDHLIFLGDYTDKPTLSPLELTYYNETMKAIASVDPSINVTLLEGNHCITDVGNTFTVLGSSSSYFESQKPWRKIILNRIMVEDLENKTRFYCYPFEDDLALLSYLIQGDNQSLSPDFTNIMLFHFPTANGYYDNGLPSKSGIMLTDEQAGNFDACFGGDFHRHQKLKGHHSAYYCGAPFDLKFGEHQERGFIIYDTEEKEIIHYKNPFQIPLLRMNTIDFVNLDEETKRSSVFEITDMDENMVDEFEGYNVRAKKTRKKKEISEDKMVNFESEHDPHERLWDFVKKNMTEDEIAMIPAPLKKRR